MKKAELLTPESFMRAVGEPDNTINFFPLALTVKGSPSLIIGATPDGEPTAILRIYFECGDGTIQRFEAARPVKDFTDERQIHDWARTAVHNLKVSLPKQLVSAAISGALTAAAHALDAEGIASIDMSEVVAQSARRAAKVQKRVFKLTRTGAPRTFKDRADYAAQLTGAKQGLRAQGKPVTQETIAEVLESDARMIRDWNAMYSLNWAKFKRE